MLRYLNARLRFPSFNSISINLDIDSVLDTALLKLLPSLGELNALKRCKSIQIYVYYVNKDQTDIK